MKNPPENLSSIPSPWLFVKWGVDLVGPMPFRKGNKRFLKVAVDYFTKWTEVEALVTITIESVMNFFWRLIICRFGIPHPFVMDNSK
jgi:hypothetical protein